MTTATMVKGNGTIVTAKTLRALKEDADIRLQAEEKELVVADCLYADGIKAGHLVSIKQKGDAAIRDAVWAGYCKGLPKDVQAAINAEKKAIKELSEYQQERRAYFNAQKGSVLNRYSKQLAEREFNALPEKKKQALKKKAEKEKAAAKREREANQIDTTASELTQVSQHILAALKKVQGWEHGNIEGKEINITFVATCLSDALGGLHITEEE